MLTHYLTLALRNLFKNKVYSVINLLGLSLGIAAFVFLWQYVRFEGSYDDFHARGEQIYRLRNDHFVGGQQVNSRATTYRDAGPSLLQDFKEVKSFVRLSSTFGNRVVIASRQKDGKVREGFEEKLFYADAAFLTLFSFPLLEGNAERALTDPYSAVLTERAARRYFGSSDALGKTLTVDGKGPFTITGILQDLPLDSHLQFDFLFSITSLADFRGRYASKWSGAGGDVAYTYIELHKGTDPVAFQAKLPGFLRKYQSEQAGSRTPTDALILQPLQAIHLQSNLELEAGQNGNPTVVYFLLLVAIGVIVIAWLNYVNLTTAHALRRAREVGVRKAMGSGRAALVGQFLLESLLLNGLAGIVAFFLLWFGVHFLADMLWVNTSFFSFQKGTVWMTLLLTVGNGAVLAGVYPALVMAAYQPVAVLKGQAPAAGKGLPLRSGLVVLQFVVSISFLCGAFAVYRQMAFMQSQSLGFNPSQILVLAAPGGVDSTYLGHLKLFRRELLDLKGINRVTASSEIPGKAFSATRIIANWGQPLAQAQRYATAWIDEAFFFTYGIRLRSGRTFSEDFRADGNGVMVNESLVRALGLASAQQAVGKRLLVQGAGECFILGVVADYHHQSLIDPVRPAAFLLNTDRNRRFISLKLSADLSSPGHRELIQRVERRWHQFFPANPFEYFFLDTFYTHQYRQQEQATRVFTTFAGLAVLIACMGLYGLVLFTTQRRTKEIGIRKVLGASLLAILQLLYGQVFKLFLIGMTAGWLLAYLFVGQWLHAFAYRMPLVPSLFLWPSLVVLLLTVVVTGLQTYRAAVTSPVKSLPLE